MALKRLTVDDGMDEVVGPLAVRTRRLRGGLQDGLLLVEIAAGGTTAQVLPDRGLGIWKMTSGGTDIGWSSPVRGPVHPQFVPITDPSGLGWLDGFDELVARCGLVSNGAPEFDPQGRLLHPLHGRIANLPAHGVEVTLDEAAGTVTLHGAVDETRFLFQSLRMTTSISLQADRPRVSWTDTVENLSDRPTTMQMLYHVNIGPPFLGAGSELVSAVEELAPRDHGAAADVPTWNRYDEPRPGRPEQVHFMSLRSDEAGRAAAMLVAPGGGDAVCLSWRSDTLPCFSLWKNQGGLADGYVTGLEPGTNYPNPRSFEAAQGRVVSLSPRAGVSFALELEHLTGPAVASVRERMAANAGPPRSRDRPRPDWSAG